MILTEFGVRLKDVRQSQGISQSKLSMMSGISRGQISRIENGQINPTLDTIFKLSDALELSLSKLFDYKMSKASAYKQYKLRPFVKWAGGKTQILDKIKELMPNEYNTYYEPFLGGGALFFNLAPDNAVINDYNEELMIAFDAFKKKEDYYKLIEVLKEFEVNHSEKNYYKVREMDRTSDFKTLPNHVKAARLIYLNKACFNGLYRVNSKGYFNVPSGKKEIVKAYDKELFDNIHDYFVNANVTIISGDFENAVKTAKKGDFVYFDPPYDTFEEQNNFTTYTKDSFGKAEQVRLSKIYKKLSDKGVYVMLSNHNTGFIRDLYKDFNINVIEAKRMINSKATGRGTVEELIITNY
ncbi:MAG TPA: Dam family site-specific DNA-(adenine-N6)-methyltransferase [Gallicola sp.]|nr:Dam family site-specific DNA-(adenine-N6)-methyltransferase [Gallicola sp.]